MRSSGRSRISSCWRCCRCAFRRRSWLAPRRDGHRGAVELGTRQAHRGGAARPGEDRARQRRRAARAALRPHDAVRPLSRLGVRPVRERGTLRRAGWYADAPSLALAGFVALTAVLSVNFNVERLYRRERGEKHRDARGARAPAASSQRVYALLYAPQDRLVERVRRVAAPRRIRARPASPTTTVPTVSVLANLRNVAAARGVRGLHRRSGIPLAFVWVSLGELLLVTCSSHVGALAIATSFSGQPAGSRD